MGRTEYELFSHFHEIGTVLLQVIIFIVIWNVFFRPKRDKKGMAAAGGLAVFNVLLKLCPIVPSWGRYAVSAAAVLVFCWIRYGKKLEKAVFVLLLFYNFHHMSFLIAGSIYQYVMDDLLIGIRNEDYVLHMYRGQIIGQCCLFLLYMLSLLIMTGVIGKIVKSPFEMNRNDVVFLSVLNVVGSMFAGMIRDISMVQIEEEVFYLYTVRKEMIWKVPLMAVLICVGEISAIGIFRKYKELQKEKEKSFVENQQMRAMKRRLEEAESFYGSIRKIRHEMKGHMTNIKGLAAGRKYEEVEKYIEKLDETIGELDYRFSTGNAITDVIINDKYRRAAKSGIAFQVRFDYRETDTIAAFDMGIILNNLLDNAIEACERLKGTKRFISLSLKRKNNFLLLEVENSFEGVLQWDYREQIPVTMKQSNLPDVLMEHGVGLGNVKDVAERYLGYMDIKTAGNIFKATVMLQQIKS